MNKIRTKSLVQAWVLACCALLLGTDALAGERACAADGQRFCPDTHNQPDRIACLLAHEEQLSEGCRASISTTRSELRAKQIRRLLGAVCRDDVETLCGEIGPGAARHKVIFCLKKHQEELSSECAAAIRGPTEQPE